MIIITWIHNDARLIKNIFHTCIKYYHSITLTGIELQFDVTTSLDGIIIIIVSCFTVPTVKLKCADHKINLFDSTLRLRGNEIIRELYFVIDCTFIYTNRYESQEW